MLDFPTPDGPEMTINLPRRGGSLGEAVNEFPGLAVGKPAQCTVLRDADLFHQTDRGDSLTYIKGEGFFN